MTIAETMKAKLIENGMWDDQAAEVIEMSKNDPANNPMIGKWNDPADDYPAIMIPGLWLSVKRNALVWIEKTMPESVFKTNFQ